MSSARLAFEKLSGLSTATRRALALGLIVAGLASFAACHAAQEESDGASARSSSTLPDWSNDTTKYRPR